MSVSPALPWFRFEATVPDDWPSDHLEAVIDLGFSGSGPGFQCEGLVYEHGEPRRGQGARKRDGRRTQQALHGRKRIGHKRGEINPLNEQLHAAGLDF